MTHQTAFDKKSRIPLFHEGEHQLSPSAKKKWTGDEIVEIAAKTVNSGKDIPFYAAPNHKDEFPIVVGKVPAKAIGVGVMPDGRRYLDFDKSLATFSNHAPSILKASGLDKLSIAIHVPTKTIDHIAFVKHPADCDMKNVAVFSAADVEYAVFSADEVMAVFGEDRWKFRLVADFIQRIRDWFIESKGLKQADEIISQWMIDELKKEPRPDLATYSSTQTNDKMKLDTRVSELESEIEALRNQLKAKDAELATFSQKVFDEKLKAILASDTFKGIITSKNMERHLKAIKALNGSGAEMATFSASEMTIELSKEAVEYLSALKEEPKIFSPDEVATFGQADAKSMSDGEKADKIAKKAAELIEQAKAKGKTMSVVDATKEAQKLYE